MPDITANTTDGYQASGLNSNWNNVHDAVGQSNPDINNTLDSFNGIRYEYVSGRGGANYYLTRAFFDFDTSGVTAKPSEADFRLKGYSNTACTPCIVCKSGHDPSTATDDWFSTWITGQSVTLSDWGASDITNYSESTAIEMAGVYTTFELNDDALNDIRDLSTFKICVLHNNDYNDTAPTSGTLKTGVYWADHGTATNRPILRYTAAPVAVTHNATFFGSNF